MAERAEQPEVERDAEDEDSDRRIDSLNVAGALDDVAADRRAERARRERQDHRDRDDAAEQMIRNERLAQAAGVDVEQDPETRRDRRERDRERIRGSVGEPERQQAAQHQRTESDVAEGE